MKNKIPFLLLILCSALCKGQAIIRQNDESKDSLIQKILKKNAVRVGKAYELNDATSSIIIYFEIISQDTSKPFEKSIESENDLVTNPYLGKATYTLFSILYSLDKVRYTNYVLDTLDYNSGCCPCHLPDLVDSIQFVDTNTRNDLILLLTHPVSFNCNSITSHYALFYEHFSDRIQSGRFSFKRIGSLPLAGNEFNAASAQALFNHFKQLKTKK